MSNVGNVRLRISRARREKLPFTIQMESKIVGNEVCTRWNTSACNGNTLCRFVSPAMPEVCKARGKEAGGNLLSFFPRVLGASRPETTTANRSGGIYGLRIPFAIGHSDLPASLDFLVMIIATRLREKGVRCGRRPVPHCRTSDARTFTS